MADCILLKGGSGGLDSDDFTATAAQVLQGYFAGVKGSDEAVEGTMVNNGVTKAATYVGMNTSAKYLFARFPAGYYYLDENGTQNPYISMAYDKVASAIGLTKYKLLAGTTVLGIAGDAAVMNTSSANAAAADIAKDKTAFVNGKKITGTGTFSALNMIPLNTPMTDIFEKSSFTVTTTETVIGNFNREYPYEICTVGLTLETGQGINLYDGVGYFFLNQDSTSNSSEILYVTMVDSSTNLAIGLLRIQFYTYTTGKCEIKMKIMKSSVSSLNIYSFILRRRGYIEK